MDTKNQYNDTVVRQFTVVTILWGVVGMLVGVFIAAQMIWPALNFDLPYFSFGRLRPLHTNAVIFALVGNMMFAGIYHSSQRLLKTRMASDMLSKVHLWGWQLIILGAALTLPFVLRSEPDAPAPLPQSPVAAATKPPRVESELTSELDTRAVRSAVQADDPEEAPAPPTELASQPKAMLRGMVRSVDGLPVGGVQLVFAAAAELLEALRQRLHRALERPRLQGDLLALLRLFDLALRSAELLRHLARVLLVLLVP